LNSETKVAQYKWKGGDVRKPDWGYNRGEGGEGQQARFVETRANYPLKEGKFKDHSIQYSFARLHFKIQQVKKGKK